jgi:hypothetical protein
MYGAIYYIMLDKSDSRAGNFFGELQRMLRAMLVANRRVKQHTSKNRARLIPRMDNDFKRRLPQEITVRGL